MKRLIILCSAVVLWLFPAHRISASTQVYDLKTDWSDTQNPNAPWSYLPVELLSTDPFPWAFGDSLGVLESIRKTTPDSAVPGFFEVGDIQASTLLNLGLGVRWTAPENGSINIAGAIWGSGAGIWDLTLNGSPVSAGDWGFSSRSAPNGLSAGSAGPEGLLGIEVEAGDQVQLIFLDFQLFGPLPFGVNFTVAFTPDAIPVDPVTAIQQLALMVAAMNLQNGIDNSLDSKLDAALKALDDLNTNNDVAACNSLAAFINAVAAQRGGKITNAQADQLIAAAQQIQSLLNCGDY